MKIIDEKGNFLGKINIIDLIAVIFLVSLLPAVYFGYKVLNKSRNIAPVLVPLQEEANKEFGEIEMDCRFVRLKPEIAEIIAVGDKEFGKDKEVVGEVIAIEDASAYIYSFETGGGNKIITEDKNLRQLPVKLRLRVSISGTNIYYQDKQVRNNQALEFITDKYQAEFILLPKKSALGENKMEEDKFNILDVKLNGLQEKLFGLDNKLSGLENRLNSFGGLDSKLTGLENRLNSLEGLDNKLSGIENRLNSTEDKLNKVPLKIFKKR